MRDRMNASFGVNDQAISSSIGFVREGIAVGANVLQDVVPGETGSVRIERGDGDGVVVPASAVWREGSRAQVFVRTGDGRYEAREVVTGRESAGLVEVVSGVAAGAPVVVRGTFLVAAESARAAE